MKDDTPIVAVAADVKDIDGYRWHAVADTYLRALVDAAGVLPLILPSLDRADQAPRMPVRVHKIEDDVLFDCDLSAQRVALGVAKKST